MLFLVRSKSSKNTVDVTVNGVVREVVDFPFRNRTEETSPTITPFHDQAELGDLTEAIKVNFASGVRVTEPNWRDSRDDVVIVDETEMLQPDKVDIGFVTNARATEGK